MRNRRWMMVVGILAGMPAFSVGQDQPPQAPTTQDSGDNTVRPAPAAAISAIAGLQTEGGAEETSSDLPKIPSLLGGSGMSTAFASEMKRSNYLRGGVNVSATYDDNALLLPSGAESNTSESIFPSIKIDESTSRMHWTLGYAGGLTVNQKITSQNEGSHNLNFDSTFRLSPHVNLRAAETFSLTTGFFDASGGGDVVVGGGGPNNSLITPLSTERSSVTTVGTTYHFALNDLAGASGSFYDLHFTNVPVGTQLTDTQTATGSAFWFHRLFRNDWGGVSYRFDRIVANPGGDETRVHSVLVVDTLSFGKGFTFSGYIGPQYSENEGLAPGATQSTQSNEWSVSGGAEGGWNGERTSVNATYSRGISDGGGVLGPTLVQNVQGNVRRVLLPGWTGGVFASHGTNQAITVPFVTSATSIHLTSAGVTLERNLGKSLGLRFSYNHDFQQQYGLPAPTPTLDASRNRFVFTLSYQWAKPLGM